MSGLPTQVVPVAFTQGQDTRVQQKLVVPGKWLELSNYSLGQDNTPRRRDGTAQLVANVTGNGIATHGNELVAVNGPSVSSYSPGQSAMETRSGAIGWVDISATEVLRANGRQDSPDMASGSSGNGTYTCYVWRDLDAFGGALGVNCELVDESTGTRLISNFQLRAGNALISPRVVCSHGAFFVFYLNGANSHLYCRVIDPSSSLTPGAEVTLINDANLVTENFDACAVFDGSSSSVMVVYQWNNASVGGTNTSVASIRVQRAGTVPSITAGPTSLVPSATIPHANILALSCASYQANPSTTGSAACFLLHLAGVSGVVINQTWAVTTAVTLLDAFVPAGGDSHIAACLTTAGPLCLQVVSDQYGTYGTAAISPIRTSGWNTTLTQVIAPQTIINSASFGTGAAPAARGPQGPWICGKPFAGTSSTASGGNPTVFLPVCILENSAFSGAAPNNNTQCSFFLLDCTSGLFTTSIPLGTVVAKALYGAVGVPAIGTAAPQVATPCSSPIIGTGNSTLVNIRGTLEISNGLNVSPTGLCRLDMVASNAQAPIRSNLGPTTFFAGGVTTTYDGDVVVEYGFNLFPEGVGAVIAAGGTVTDGVHQLVAVYEWVDAQGQRHQSSPSLPVSVTAGGGNNTITVNAPTLLLTQKSGVNIVLYMTQADGTVFFRLPLGSAAVNGPAPNSSTAAFVAISVTASDAAIGSNEALYTQPDQGGSTLPNDAPPPCKALCVSQNRLWLLNEDSPLEYRYSQELLNGFGLQFGGLFGDITLGGLVPTESGGTVAVSPLDEKTIIFCQKKLYVVYGTGPDSSGSNNNFSDPQELPSPVGCSDARSVLLMPQGIIFKAQSGWHLLGRDLNVHYIGDGVSLYDGNRVGSAVLMRDRQECRWETVDGDGIGATLVFSYLIGQWSVFFRNYDVPVPAVDALWWQTGGYYVFLNASTTSVPGLFQDVPLGHTGADDPDDFAGSGNSVVVTTVAKTSWLKLTALEGFQRCRRVLWTLTPNDAPINFTGSTLSVAFNDDNNQSINYTVLLDPLSSGLGTSFDFRHKLHVQKCKSVQFVLKSIPQGSSNPSVILGIQALALEIAVKTGVRKLAAANTV